MALDVVLLPCPMQPGAFPSPGPRSRCLLTSLVLLLVVLLVPLVLPARVLVLSLLRP